jgi:hypothetical protein
MALAVRSPMARRSHWLIEATALRNSSPAALPVLVEGDEGDLRAPECGGELAEVADAPGQAVELRDHEGIPPAPPLGQLGEQAL